MTKIALIGDRQADVVAHQAIPKALDLEARAQGVDLTYNWFGTEDLSNPSVLGDYDGGWIVPASPYANTENALAAIRYFRETGATLLGTCGGYQHALVEYARNVLGYSAAGLEENDPDCEMLLISALSCALVEQSDPVMPEPGSRFSELVGTSRLTETYHCAFGLNPRYADLFDGTDFKVAARDPNGAVRAMELSGDRFYLGTAFQPERAALQGRRHPIVSALVAAMVH